MLVVGIGPRGSASRWPRSEFRNPRTSPSTIPEIEDELRAAGPLFAADGAIVGATFAGPGLAGPSPATTSNAKRTSLGLPPHDETRNPTPAPTTAPFGRIASDRPLHQTISWVDDESSLSRAKPEGVHHCELWLQIDGAPPVDDTTCKLVKRITRSEYTYIFKAADVGKTAYWLRWVSEGAEEGPFGQVVSARING